MTDTLPEPSAGFDEIRILAPVWGEPHLRQFLDFCVASLLADGNVPAVAARFRTVFVLFTQSADAGWVARDPMWAALARVCDARIEAIDELISRSSSTVLTLAYLKGIRASGEAATRTAFVFLVGDYVFADGAIGGIVARMVAGAGAVLAGNYQITDEGARERLAALRDPGTDVLAVPPRQLVGLSLDHLHPATLAAFADDPVRHDPATNRLFWWLDRDAILGRFYLLHMIAIRPETATFSVSAPSDYGLVPALCPTGRVEAITDSDEYFVVELQPAAQPRPDFRFGPRDPNAFAASLRDWATALHWDNARHRIVFHAGDPPEAIARSDGFVDAVAARRAGPALSPVEHPIWARSLDHHLATAASPDAAAALDAVLGRTAPAVARQAGPVRGRAALIGRVPDARPWHPRYADFRLVRDRLCSLASGRRVAIVAAVPPAVAAALVEAARQGGARDAVLTVADRSAPADGRYDLVLVVTNAAAPPSPARICGLATWCVPGGHLLIGVGAITADEGEAVSAAAVTLPAPLAGAGLGEATLSGIATGPLREAVQGSMMAQARTAIRAGRGGAAWRLALAACLAPVSAGLNHLHLRNASRPGPGPCSSVLIQLVRTIDRVPDADRGSLPPADRPHR